MNLEECTNSSERSFNC